MAFRSPRFMFDHSGRTGLSSIVHSTEKTGFVMERVADNSIRRLATWDGTSGTQWVAWDGGTGRNAIDRLIIPAGHNLTDTTAATIDIRANGSAFTAETDGSSKHSFTATAGLITEEFTAIPYAVGANRYLCITITANGEQREVPELVLSQTRVDTDGPDPRWTDQEVPNQVEVTLRSGATFRTARGPAKRQLAFDYHALSGTDLAVFTEMRTETQNGLYPVWVDPAGDDAAPEDPVPMRITRFELTQDFAVPLSLVTYSLRLELEEVTS